MKSRLLLSLLLFLVHGPASTQVQAQPKERIFYSSFRPEGWDIYTNEHYGIMDEQPLVQNYFFSPQMYGEIVALRLSDMQKVRLTHNKWEEGAPQWVKEINDKNIN